MSSLLRKDRLTTIRLYRVLQRICKDFTVNNHSDRILLQPQLEASHWGRHKMFYQFDSQSLGDMFRLLHTWNDDMDDWYHGIVGKNSSEMLPPMTSETVWTSVSDLKKAIRAAFRTDYGVDPTTMHRWAIRAIQVLEEQQRMWSHSSCETTENIRVTATSRCVGTSSSFSHFPSALDPRLKHYRPGTGSPPNFEDKHRFAYRIRIENISEEEHIQLLGRYWYIQEGEDDGSEETDDPVIVDAPKTGVVGQLPVLRPGQVFEYMSGADLESRKGSMVGHFYMVKTSEKALSAKSGDEIELKDGDKFEAVVAPFPLVAN